MDVSAGRKASVLPLLDPGGLVLVRVIILVCMHPSESDMSRLTITLSERRYLALKEASVQRRKTIGQLIEESLDSYGIKPREDARELVRRARESSALDEAKAIALANEEVQAVRRSA